MFIFLVKRCISEEMYFVIFITKVIKNIAEFTFYEQTSITEVG